MAGRQLQRFGSNQLVSLLDWAGGHLVSPSSILGQQLRMASTSSLNKSLKYSKERKGYQSNLSELRKAWAKEQEEAALRRATEAEALEAKRWAAKSQRARDDAADKETRRQELLVRQQAARELRAKAKEERLRRQELRMDILDAARAARREGLVRESRHWIDAESLDARVQEALDNAVPLWGAPKGQQAGGPAS